MTKQITKEYAYFTFMSFFNIRERDRNSFAYESFNDEDGVLKS